MKPTLAAIVLLCVSLAGGFGASAQASSQAGKEESKEESAIRAVLSAQSEAWNRGDIPAFMQAYENSTDTTFIGASIGKGYERILERYRKHYSNTAQMGKLTYNDLEVRLLKDSCGNDAFALVTGRFHLDRAERGEAKKDDGTFSLFWRKGPDGWKIILDHTS